MCWPQTCNCWAPVLDIRCNFSFLTTVVLIWGFLSLRERLAMSEDSFDCHNYKRCKWHPRAEAEMQLNILQYTGQDPTMKNHPIQNVNSAAHWETLL